MVGARTCEPLVKISMRAAGRGCIGRGTRLIVVAEIVSPHPATKTTATMAARFSLQTPCLLQWIRAVRIFDVASLLVARDILRGSVNM